MQMRNCHLDHAGEHPALRQVLRGVVLLGLVVRDVDDRGRLRPQLPRRGGVEEVPAAYVQHHAARAAAQGGGDLGLEGVQDLRLQEAPLSDSELNLRAARQCEAGKLGEQQACGGAHRATQQEHALAVALCVGPEDAGEMLNASPAAFWVLEIPCVCGVADVQRVHIQEARAAHLDLAHPLRGGRPLRHEADRQHSGLPPVGEGRVEVKALAAGQDLGQQRPAAQRRRQRGAVRPAAVPADAQPHARQQHVGRPQRRDVQQVPAEAHELERRHRPQHGEDGGRVAQCVSVRVEKLKHLELADASGQRLQPIVLDLQHAQLRAGAELLGELLQAVALQHEVPQQPQRAQGRRELGDPIGLQTQPAQLAQPLQRLRGKGPEQVLAQGEGGQARASTQFGPLLKVVSHAQVIPQRGTAANLQMRSLRQTGEADLQRLQCGTARSSPALRPPSALSGLGRDTRVGRCLRAGVKKQEVLAIATFRQSVADAVARDAQGGEGGQPRDIRRQEGQSIAR
mmetsp:Transcript_55932/g.160686  ORF Transcript_55932/g.160686 Transcript_55932/m.160686 type:complete len:512 (+) Transcript_55932:171-1706(+)